MDFFIDPSIERELIFDHILSSQLIKEEKEEDRIGTGSGSVKK